MLGAVEGRNKGRFEENPTSVDWIIRSNTDAVASILTDHALTAKASAANIITSQILEVKRDQVGCHKVIITRWLRGAVGRFQLNSDGCSRGNPGLSRGGSILRSCIGKVQWAQADFYGFQTNMVAEARALMQGFQRCVANGILDVDVEADSLVLVNILKKEVAVPWAILYELNQIGGCLDMGYCIHIEKTIEEVISLLIGVVLYRNI